MSLDAFEQRATLAETKLAALEAAFASFAPAASSSSSSSSGGGNDSERVAALEAENGKLKYQILHLIRSLTAEEEAREQETSELKEKVGKLEYQVLHLIRSLEEAEAAQ